MARTADLPGSGTSPERASGLGPIEPTPLRVRVAGILRSAIITGKLRPGTPLVETALAEQLNVSRAPIREAIQDLENDGLVETSAYRGKRVKPLTVREVSETCDMRQRFEVMAVRRILDRGADVGMLWAPCDAMRQAAEAGDREALVAADEVFHSTLIRLSNHDLLGQLWRGLYLRIHQIMSLRNDHEVDLLDIAATHPPIVRALESGDTSEAVRLIAEHADALADFDPASIADGPQ